jgi:hypothetical protein
MPGAWVLGAWNLELRLQKGREQRGAVQRQHAAYRRQALQGTARAEAAALSTSYKQLQLQRTTRRLFVDSWLVVVAEFRTQHPTKMRRTHRAHHPSRPSLYLTGFWISVNGLRRSSHCQIALKNATHSRAKSYPFSRPALWQKSVATAGT